MIQGFILAAGEGRRLRPATLTRSKALVPFCGVPLLELVISQFSRLGLETVGVNACYQSGRVFEAAERYGAKYGLDTRVSLESRLLDSGGSLRHGLKLLPDCEHVLVHNVDEIIDFDLQRLIDNHLETGAAATLLLAPGRGAQNVRMGADGAILALREAGKHSFCGVHIIRRDFLENYLPATGPSCIIAAYQRALAAGERINGCSIGGSYWTDLGTTRDYIRAHGGITDCALQQHPRLRSAVAEQASRRAAWEQKGVFCTGAIGFGEGLIIPPGAHLHNVVLWDYTQLSEAVLHSDGVFVGDTVRPATPATRTRTPDPRIYKTLDMDPEKVQLSLLPKQGSGRLYGRLLSEGNSWLWCAYTPERQENAGYTAIADFLSRLGIRVPEVLLHLADSREIVSRDLGKADILGADSRDKHKFLIQAVELVARLHVLGEKAVRLEELPLQRGFTKGLYDWERDYFREHVLGTLLGEHELWSLAADDYPKLRDGLLCEPQVPIHRDFQSANLMVVDGEVYFIDFQGMRLGAAVYDVASLLFDPYQCHPRELRDEIWEHYIGVVCGLGGTPPDRKMLAQAAVQRLFQALGAYGKLWLRDGHEWYRAFLEPGAKMLAEAASECGLDGVGRLALIVREKISKRLS